MPLIPPEDRTTPEAILDFGLYGSGKTEDWACIADAYRHYGNTGHFHVLSTEYERVMASMEGRVGWRDNVTIYEVEDWPTLGAATREINDKVKGRLEETGTLPLDNQDFLVIDTAGPALRWSRDFYFLKTRGTTYREFQETGAASTEIAANEWQQMESLYLEWFNPLVMRFPGHKFITAQADSFGEGKWAPKDGSTIKRVFGRVAQKAVGYKELAAQVHTVIYKTNPTVGTYEITNIKDRPTREKVSYAAVLDPGEPLFGFVMSYLVPIAGWRMT